MTYEEALAALEEIIGKMESGSMPLDESIDYFKKGTELIKYCENLLDKYEKLITTVTAGPDGEIVENSL